MVTSIASAPLLLACVNMHERPVAPEEIGLTESEILRIETLDWPGYAARWGYGSDSRPVGVRDLSCRLEHEPDIYRCYYRLDYLVSGEARTRRRGQAFGREENGQWVMLLTIIG